MSSLALLLVSVAARADNERRLDQYTHLSWTIESNAPRPVFALAQASDGYLWVATGRGLFRFDGLHFDLVSSKIDLVANGAPSALLVRRNGEVWTNFDRSGRFAVYRRGRLTFLDAPPSPARVSAMHETSDGTIWVLTERIGTPLLRYRGGAWTKLDLPQSSRLDNPFSMVVTKKGLVWLSFSDGLARVSSNGSGFDLVREIPRFLGRLSLDPSERVWVTDRKGSYPLTGPEGRGTPPPLRFAYATDQAEIRGSPAFDRHGNLWIATYYDGVQRVARPDLRGAPSAREARMSVERFATGDGLSSNATAQIFQDQQGNVWVATQAGLDRFWPSTVRFEPLLTNPAAFGDLLLSARDGSVYIAEASAVYRVRPGGRPEAILRSAVEPRTLCEAPDGAIWIGINKDVVIWRNGRMDRLPHPVPVTYTIYDCAFDRTGAYWVSASLGGLARYTAGRWQQMFGRPRNDFVPKSMVSDEQGNLVLTWNDRTLSRISPTSRTSAAIPWGQNEPNGVTLQPAGDQTVLVAGGFGLARYRDRDRRFQTISARRLPQLSGVNGIVRTSAGQTWLATPAGIVRVTSAALDRAFADPAYRPPVQTFDAADGLRSGAHDHSRHSLVQGGDGRLWIATQTGTVWLDPSDIARSSAPPRVAISKLVADRTYVDPAEVKLPAGSSDLEIDFSAMNFSDPRAVRVRYRLEGQDSNWIDAGSRREAFYTNLSPGDYRFRVIAATTDGAWDRDHRTLVIHIPPTFVQSRWFLLLCAIAALLIMLLLYRLRLAQVEQLIRGRLEERIAERERIARELHDTLLQSVQGLVLRFQSVANRMPAGADARRHLEGALDRADQVMAEGRERVRELRGADGSEDLLEMLERRARDVGFDDSVTFKILVEGRPRPLEPLAAVELGKIAGEALLNVAHHAKATSVQVAARFEARQLVLQIRDNGVGIAEDIVRNGYKPNHYGIVGMSERAERIGGSFELESSRGAGSTVSIILPARFAYRQAIAQQSLGRRFWQHLKRVFHG